MTEQAIEKRTSRALIPLSDEQLQALDQTAEECRECVLKNDGTPSAILRQAASMQALREMLSPEVMKPIMALQGNRLGFLTDRDRKRDERGRWVTGDGYDEPAVRDVTIWAIGKGARMCGNEVNIISSGGYLTKEHMFRRLDDTLGSGNWMLVHSTPRVVGDKGAVVQTEVRWRLGGIAEWQTQALENAVKGDAYATADSYKGKADRKCAAWLLNLVSGEYIPDGDAEDAINITADVSDAPNHDPIHTAANDLEARLRQKAAERAAAASVPASPPPAPRAVTPEEAESLGPVSAKPAPAPADASTGTTETPAAPNGYIKLSEILSLLGEDISKAELVDFCQVMGGGWAVDRLSALGEDQKASILQNIDNWREGILRLRGSESGSSAETVGVNEAGELF